MPEIDVNDDDGFIGGDADEDKFKIFPDGEEDPLADNRALFPEFSWDRTRTWMAIRKAGRYSNDDIKMMASQDVVMLEKQNGYKIYGSVEAGCREAAKRVKAVNSKVKVRLTCPSAADFVYYLFVKSCVTGVSYGNR